MTNKEVSDKVENHDTSIKLIEQSLTYMTTGIAEIKESIKNGLATKKDLDTLDMRVKNIESIKDWAIKIVLGAIIVSLLAVIGLKAH